MELIEIFRLNQLIATYHGNKNTCYIGTNVIYKWQIFDKDTWYEIKDLNYHKSWNWLMPVIEKIINEHSSDVMFTGENYLPTISVFFFSDEKRGFTGESENSLIEAAYNAVIDYIKNINP